jgi:hypothetical protein
MRVAVMESLSVDTFEALMHMEEVRARGRVVHGTLQACQVHRFTSVDFGAASPPHACRAARVQALEPASPCYYTGVEAGYLNKC